MTNGIRTKTRTGARTRDHGPIDGPGTMDGLRTKYQGLTRHGRSVGTAKYTLTPRGQVGVRMCLSDGAADCAGPRDGDCAGIHRMARRRAHRAGGDVRVHGEHTLFEPEV